MTSISDNWYQTPTGQLLLEQVKAEIMPYINTYPKKMVLQLGLLDLLDQLPKHPVSHRFSLSSAVSQDPSSTSICGNYCELPISDESIDLTLLPHLFDQETQLKEILTECYRVMSPRGHLIIIGINPCSLLGLARLLAPQYFPTYFHQMTSAQKVRYHLRSLEAELILSKTFFYHLPTNKLPTKNWQWLEKFGQITFPFVGGLYLIIAKKRIITPTLIKPRWSWEQVLAPKTFNQTTTSGVRHG